MNDQDNLEIVIKKAANRWKVHIDFGEIRRDYIVSALQQEKGVVDIYSEVYEINIPKSKIMATKV